LRLTAGKGRLLLAVLLLPAAFYFLGLSDPQVTFLAREKAWWALESRFHLSSEARPRGAVEQTLQAEIVVANRRLHPNIRVRFSTCPAELPSCVPGHFLSLKMPESGSQRLRFPVKVGEVKIEAFREPFHPLFLLSLGCLLASALLAFPGTVEKWLAVAWVLTAGPYFAITAGLHRALDLRGHVEHVELIAREGLLVPAMKCWECFQPPFYYAGASVFLLFPERIWPAGVLQLQGLAFLLSLLWIPLVVGAIRPFSREGWPLFLFSALVCLWPAAVLQGVRVGNDPPQALLAFLALWLLASKQWLPAMGAAALALLVKNNGAVVLGVCGAMVGLAWLRRELKLSSATGALLLAVLALGANAALQKAKSYSHERLAIMPEKLRSIDRPAELLLPHPAAFLTEPFVNPWNSTPNRNHTPNYFWKTSLTGEWDFGFPGAETLALALGGALTILLACAALIFLRGRHGLLLPGLCLALSFLAILAFRGLYHYANHADFRFVYPLTAFGIAAILASARQRRLELAARGATILFLLLGQAFFALHWVSELG
jgi:hypothetical protein